MLMLRVPLYLTLNNIDVEVDSTREVKLVDFKVKGLCDGALR